MRITIDDSTSTSTSTKYKKYKKKFKKRRIKKTKTESAYNEQGLDSPVKKSDYNFSAYGRRMTRI